MIRKILKKIFALDSCKNVRGFCWINLTICSTKPTRPHGGFIAFHYLTACASKTFSCMHIIWTWTVIIKANQNSKWNRYTDQDNYESENKEQLKNLTPFRGLSNSYQNISVRTDLNREASQPLSMKISSRLQQYKRYLHFFGDNRFSLWFRLVERAKNKFCPHILYGQLSLLKALKPIKCNWGVLFIVHFYCSHIYAKVLRMITVHSIIPKLQFYYLPIKLNFTLLKVTECFNEPSI